MTDTLITPAADERDWADNLAAFLERDALKAGSWGSWGGDDGGDDDRIFVCWLSAIGPGIRDDKDGELYI